MNPLNAYHITIFTSQHSTLLLLLMLFSALFVVLWDDWRLSLLGWAGMSMCSGLLLLIVWPLPWALSRTIAMALEGAIMWFGAHRWPKNVHRLAPYSLTIRVPLLIIVALVIWQSYTYFSFISIPTPMLHAVLIFLGSGFVLLTTGGDILHGTLGLLSVFNAALFILAALPVPTDWFILFTILDLSVGLIGGMGVASHSAYVYSILRIGERR